MLCETCNKLAILYTNKKCLKCQGAITINISVVCEICSKSTNTCSACLKKLTPALTKKTGGCKTCGRK